MEGLEFPFRGRICRPHELLYKQTLAKLWNDINALRVSPAAVLFPAGTHDVVEAVRFARGKDLRVSVLNGGTNPSAAGLDGQLLLVLPSGVVVDGPKKIARVEAGSLWSHLDWELALFGLCVPGPTFERIGVTGSTLGGGWGYLTKQHGLTRESVDEMEVVTADARVLHISKMSHSGLFQALLGGAGAGALCIVTRLQVRLFDAPAVVYNGELGWEMSAVASWSIFIAAFLSLHKDWPSSFICFPTLMDDRVLLMVFCEGGEHVAAPLLQPLFDAVGARPTINVDCRNKSYLEAQQFCTAVYPQRIRVFTESRFVILTEDMWSKAIEHMAKLPPDARKWSRIMFQNFFVSSDEECYLFIASAQWSDANIDDVMFAWTQDIVKEASQGLGAAANFSSALVPLVELFNRDHLFKFESVKRKYDPENFFSRSLVWDRNRQNSFF